MGADIITLRENEHIALTYRQSYTLSDKVSLKGRSLKQVIPYLTLPPDSQRPVRHDDHRFLKMTCRLAPVSSISVLPRIC